jgi:DNA polymerase III epsilon subunit-like protein
MTKPVHSRHSAGKYILVLDTETSGSSFGSYEETFSQYQAISFGAVIATSDTFEPVKELYFKVKFDGKKYQWTPEAEKIHGITREELEETGLENEEAAAMLAEFILDNFGTGKVMFLGHNPWFDIEAMRQLLGPHGVMPDLHHVVLDTSALGFITVGKYRSNDVFELFLGGRSEKHNALDDAKMTLTIARSVREIMNGFFAG